VYEVVAVNKTYSGVSRLAKYIIKDNARIVEAAN
jgi:hypothetical protein